jgi:hypothetical protein
MMGKGLESLFILRTILDLQRLRGYRVLKGSDTDDKPQEEGSRSADLQRDVDGKAKEVKDPKPKQGSNHNASANEIKLVQVESFILSPNKALLISPTKVSSESKSLRWGG